MNLYEKFLEIQRSVDRIVKDGANTNDKYDYTSSGAVLNIIRPMLNEHRLLLIPRITSHNIIEGMTRSGTARFVVELELDMLWVDTESGETMPVPFYANGADLGSAERAVGKALTYAEKYFMLKFFHVPTDKDDPDADKRTKRGEKEQRGTAAEKENAMYFRKAIPQMLSELSGGDAEKIRAGYISLTKSDKRGYAGVDNIGAVSDAALPMVYAKLKKQYESRVGHPFELVNEEVSE